MIITVLINASQLLMCARYMHDAQYITHVTRYESIGL